MLLNYTIIWYLKNLAIFHCRFGKYGHTGNLCGLKIRFFSAPFWNLEKCLKQNPHFIDDFQVEARRAVARENVGHDYDPDWDDAGIQYILIC